MVMIAAKKNLWNISIINGNKCGREENNNNEIMYNLDSTQFKLVINVTLYLVIVLILYIE